MLKLLIVKLLILQDLRNFITREDNEVTDEDEELEEIDLAPKPDKEALDFFAGYAARKVSEKRIDGIFVITIDPRVDHIFL